MAKVIKVCKLTNQDWETYGSTKWGPNVTHETDGSGELCSKGWVHVYVSPEVAAFMNPVHADFADPVLWEADAEGQHKSDCGLKEGYTKVTTLRIITLPELSTTARVRVAIKAALFCKPSKNFRLWAERWLDGSNRSVEAATRAAWEAEAAEAAAEAAWAATRAASANLAARATAEAAAEAAAWAAWAATLAALEDRATASANLAAQAAEAAAWAAAWETGTLDLTSLIRTAIAEEEQLARLAD